MNDNNSDNDIIYNNTTLIKNFNYINIIPYFLLIGVFSLFIYRFYYACKPIIIKKINNNNLKSLLIDDKDLIEELFDYDCCICLSKLLYENEKIIKLKCGHYYHSECLIKSRNYGHDFCPLCRKNIV
jgi:hypothetical protein